MTTYFITGTDTSCGKTFLTVELLKQANKNGLNTLGLKPIATEAIETPEGLRNDDVLQHQQHASIKLPYDKVNLLTAPAPVSPHIPITENNLNITAKSIADFCTQTIQEAKPDITYIEGTGGFLCPLNATETLADIPQHIDCEIILVVAIRLGCLNHSLLTIEAIQQRGYKLAGWIANIIGEPMYACEENIDYLKRCIPAPCLSSFPGLSGESITELEKEKEI